AINFVNCYIAEISVGRLGLKIVVMTREQGTGNREEGRGNREQGTGKREEGRGKRLRRERQPNGFGQLYFSLLVSVFFRSLT
ncbi:MAG: hypothetical protein ACK5P3_07870, partial [Dolichospermum sp.]